MSETPFNLETLLGRFRGSIKIVEQVCDEFEAQTRRDLESLSTSLAENDGGKLAAVAHALRGAAGILSASGVERLATQLEHMGRDGHLVDAETCLANLKVEIAKCTTHIAVARARMSKGQL